jgi:hypothetical protein
MALASSKASCSALAVSPLKPVEPVPLVSPEPMDPPGVIIWAFIFLQMSLEPILVADPAAIRRCPSF